MDKSLQNKAIDFKGKKYVLVSDRVIYFNETYPMGEIHTEIVSPMESQTIVVKATVIPNDVSAPNKGRSFTGHSQAVIGEGYINKTSALENAETSAVGRALAFMGIGVIEAIASVDEINKAQTTGYGSKASPRGKFEPQEHPKEEQSPLEAAKSMITSCRTKKNLLIIEDRVRESKEFDDEEKDELYALIDRTNLK